MNFDVAAYWDRRYDRGGTSGNGSQGEWAQRKADYVNALVQRENIASVIDWGCGDGEQLTLMDLPGYIGVDQSIAALRICRRRFPDRKFLYVNQARGLTAELALSLDVVFHLPDDDEFHDYLRALFNSATRFVCVHGTDHEYIGAAHYRSREWLVDALVRFPQWQLVERPTEPMGFFLFRR